MADRKNFKFAVEAMNQAAQAMNIGTAEMTRLANAMRPRRCAGCGGEFEALGKRYRIEDDPSRWCGPCWRAAPAIRCAVCDAGMERVEDDLWFCGVCPREVRA